jgi:hypothetical protein
LTALVEIENLRVSLSHDEGGWNDAVRGVSLRSAAKSSASSAKAARARA